MFDLIPFWQRMATYTLDAYRIRDFDKRLDASAKRTEEAKRLLGTEEWHSFIRFLRLSRIF